MRRSRWFSGPGGDRDATKRPAMGEVAARLADRVVLTADNSRGEPTGAIIDAVRQGFDRATPRHATDLVIEPDRRAAIANAIGSARDGDFVLIAGKGHEQTLTIGDEVDSVRRPAGGPRGTGQAGGGSSMIRMLVAAALAMAVSLVGTRFLIRFLRAREIGQPIREEGPQGHITKAGTPTMGGLAIVGSAAFGWLLADIVGGNEFTRRGRDHHVHDLSGRARRTHRRRPQGVQGPEPRV